MKLFNESFANIKSFPDINLVVVLMTFFFLTAKDLMLADSPSLNFIVILAFLVPLRSKIFSLIVYNFLFFFFFLPFSKVFKASRSSSFSSDLYLKIFFSCLVTRIFLIKRKYFIFVGLIYFLSQKRRPKEISYFFVRKYSSIILYIANFSHQKYVLNSSCLCCFCGLFQNCYYLKACKNHFHF